MLPLTKLKIDRALIAPLCNSHDDSPIVSSTIILAKRLGLEVIAEGVETREQVVCLKLAGCDSAQGYHFSRPLSPAQLLEYPPFSGAREPPAVLPASPASRRPIAANRVQSRATCHNRATSVARACNNCAAWAHACSRLIGPLAKAKAASMPWAYNCW